MNDETIAILVMGGFAVMLICWTYYHCLMRQHEKYEQLKKAFDDYVKTVEITKPRPQVKPVAKRIVAKKTTVTKVKK